MWYLHIGYNGWPGEKMRPIGKGAKFAWSIHIQTASLSACITKTKQLFEILVFMWRSHIPTLETIFLSEVLVSSHKRRDVWRCFSLTEHSKLLGYVTRKCQHEKTVAWDKRWVIALVFDKETVFALGEAYISMCRSSSRFKKWGTAPIRMGTNMAAGKTTTFVIEFCCKSVNLSLEELKNITMILFPTQEPSKLREISSEISRFLTNSAVM